MGLRSLVVKKYHTHSSKCNIEERENLLNRDFNTSGINQKWCTDITYIHTIQDGWTYLASVMDFHSRKGNPYDNAYIESFHSILKKEEIHHNKYFDFKMAQMAIFEYIESWYIRKRIHGSLNYMTPQAFEDASMAAA